MALSITALCTACDACLHVCPQQAIIERRPYYVIRAERCTECTGDYADPQCASICPVEGAILDAQGVALNPPGSLTGITPDMLPPPSFAASSPV